MTAHDPDLDLTQRAKDAERRPVPGYEGSYEVSADGQVYSLARIVERSNGRQLPKKERILRQSLATNGYWMVTLSLGARTKTFTVHSLVAAAFIGPRPDGWHACHNDGEKGRNHANNIRYDTPKGNNADKHKHGTAQAGERGSAAKLTADDVRKIRLSLAKGKRQRDIAEAFGVSKSLIGAINTRRVWQ